MYKEIDELIETITEDQVFKDYCHAESQLYDEKTLALLSRHQIAQEDYMRSKAYQSAQTLIQMRETLKEINNEMAHHPQIVHYYQTYHALNDLLEDVTKMIFADISDDISLERLTL